ncbi:MAG: hypothetical protein AAF547_08440 [Actinomycetota bacterium]
MSRIRSRLALFALALSLGLAACGGADRTIESAGTDLVGEFATIDGGTVNLAELQDQDVVLWFWAPW